MAVRLTRTNWVASTAIVLIAVQLVIRAILAFRGYFYWDDLILVGRAGTQNLFSPTYLFDDHDGHVMPAAFLVAGAIAHLAPLNWIGPAISLVVLQLLASLALLRALHVILGWRPVLLIPLIFALFTPLAVPGFAWWAAALNSLPMLAAMAWVCADAILLVRTGNQRYVVTALLVFFGGLLFFEKSAVIPFVAFTITALLAHVTGDGSTLRTVWRRGARLWTGSLALTAAWIVLYLVVVDQERWSRDLPMTRDLLSRSITHGIVPGLVGGPWDWQRWAPASPWATPPVAVMVLGWLVLAAVVIVSFLRKERIGMLWLVAVGYAIACQIPIYLMRSSRFTALELAQTLRYLPDLVVVLALLAAVGLCAPTRERSRWLDASPVRTAVIVTAAVAFIASSLYSTATFTTIGARTRLSPTCRTPKRAWPTRMPPPTLRCLTRKSTHWCSNASPHRRTWPATCSPCWTTGPNSAARQHNYACSTTPAAWSTPRSPGCAPSSGDQTLSAATWDSQTSPCACLLTDRCCPRTGPRRSTTSPTVRVR